MRSGWHSAGVATPKGCIVQPKVAVLGYPGRQRPEELVVANPEGVASFSPGLPYSATLGDGAEEELVVANPKGVASFSPGLPYSATLGDGAAEELVIANLEGVAVCNSKVTQRGHVSSFIILARETQPLRGWTYRNPRSQGSRVRQPWADGRNPFGVGARIRGLYRTRTPFHTDCRAQAFDRTAMHSISICIVPSNFTPTVARAG